jgi:VWFA-related protein
MPPRAAIVLLSLLQSRQEVIIRTHSYTPPSTALRAETNLVEVPLTVRDWTLGHAVPGLHASDFEVLDNGVPQKITAFSELRSDGKPSSTATRSENVAPAAIPPAEPKFVTFFLDDDHVANGGMLFVKRAAHAFIAKGLKPSDKVSIVTASGEGDLDFTGDAKLFADKLDHLSSHDRPEVPSHCGVGATESYMVLHNIDGQVIEAAIGAATPCACTDSETAAQCRPKALSVAQQMASSMWEQTQAQNMDTITAMSFAAKRLSEVNGTRIMVMTSPGFLIDPGDPGILRFIDAAVRWNIVVHAIDAGGLSPFATLLRQSLFRMPLEKVTDGTGGHLFKNTNDLAAAMDLATNPEVTYLLAFNPGTRDGKFHALKIRLKSHRSDDIQFRPGYFSPVDQTKALSARATLDDAVFSKVTLRDIPAKVALAAGQPKNGTIPLSVAVTVDLNHLQFVPDKGRHVQQIVFLTTLLDANGAFVTGKESIMDLALTDEKLASLQKEGLKTLATLNAPAGIYQVRTIVREAMKGSLAASTMPIDLRSH